MQHGLTLLVRYLRLNEADLLDSLHSAGISVAREAPRFSSIHNDRGSAAIDAPPLSGVSLIDDTSTPQDEPRWIRRPYLFVGNTPRKGSET
jgi:hypothetical protein